MRHERSSIARRYSLRANIAIGVALVASFWAASQATATTLGEGSDAVRSLVVPVAEAPVPSLPAPVPSPPPKPALPAIPPAPVAVPATPQAPAKVPSVPSPSSPSGQLAPATAGDPPRVSGTGAGSPSDNVTSGNRRFGGAVTGASTEGVPSGTDSDSGGFDASLNRRSGNETSAITGSGARAVGAAEAAPLRRWLAYVWPAVALGPFAGVVAMLLPDWGGANSLPVPAAARLFAHVLGIAASSGGSALFGQPVMSSQLSRPAPYSVFTPSGGGMSLFVTILAILGALLGVVALARLTVGEEFFSMRWLH